MKRTKVFVICALLVLFSVSGEVPVTAKETVTLKLGTILSNSFVITQEMVSMSERINKRTDGGLKIEVFGDALLGKEAEMYESLFMGTLDIALESIAFQGTSHPELAIEDLPYMFKTRQDGYDALDGEYGAKICEIIGRSGEIRCLGFLEMGLRQMTNNVRPIVKPEDIIGIKIRTTTSALRLAVFEALKALPISMSFSEVFTALQQNVVDGQESPLTTINSSSFYDVQKYLSLTGHFWTNECFLINEDRWQSLPKEWQDIMVEELKVASDNVRERLTKEDELLVQKMKEKGMEINEVDKDAFIKALTPLYDEWEKKVIGSELMNAYRKYSGYEE